MGWPHTDMWLLKIRRDISITEVCPWRNMGSQPHTRPRVQVPGKEDPITSGCENQQRLWLSEMEGSWNYSHSSYGTCAQIYSLTYSLALGSGAGAVAQGALGAYGEELTCLASGLGLEGQCPPRQKRWQNPLFLC